MSWISNIWMIVIRWWHIWLSNQHLIGETCLTYTWYSRWILLPNQRFFWLLWSLFFWSRIRTRFTWCMWCSWILELVDNFSWRHRFKHGSILIICSLLIGSIWSLSLPYFFLNPNLKTILFNLFLISDLIWRLVWSFVVRISTSTTIVKLMFWIKFFIWVLLYWILKCNGIVWAFIISITKLN